ncbi:MAG: hypothetical protein ICV83_05550, partial [Cytophagales bacterium]|nr:hypothetical protein [Cytophagales bacterium]
HSLNGTQVLNRIEQQLGVKVEFEELFEYATVASLSAHVDRLLEAGKVADYQQILPVAPQPHYPLSHAQERIWILSQLEEGLLAYNISSHFILKGTVDRHALDRAFQTLVARHEVLRTTFITVQDEPRQQVHDPADFGFRVQYQDLRGQADAEPVGRAIIREDLTTAFDLRNGPLFKAKLLQLDHDAYLFSLNIHHSIADAWSMEVLVKEVLVLYKAYSAGEENPLKPLSIQYKDYCAWQNSYLTDEKIRDEKAYWLREFETAPPVLELSDHPRSSYLTFEGETINLEIEPALTHQVRESLAQTKATLFVQMLSAFKVLIAKYTGQEDITIGAPVSGRGHENLHDLIGCFVNLVPLRSGPESSKTFGQFVAEMKEKVVGAFQHSNLQFQELVQLLGVKADANRNPLFDIVFILENDAKAARQDDATDFSITPLDNDVNTSHFDLTLTVMEQADTLTLSLNYASKLFERSSAEAMLLHFKEILGQVSANMEVKIEDIEISHGLQTVQPMLLEAPPSFLFS